MLRIVIVQDSGYSRLSLRGIVCCRVFGLSWGLCRRGCLCLVAID